MDTNKKERVIKSDKVWYFAWHPPPSISRDIWTCTLGWSARIVCIYIMRHLGCEHRCLCMHTLRTARQNAKCIIMLSHYVAIVKCWARCTIHDKYYNKSDSGVQTLSSIFVFFVLLTFFISLQICILFSYSIIT